MKFTKTQVYIMALLGVVIVLMLGGIFLLDLVPNVQPVDVPDVKHEKVRLSRTSLNPHISRENSFGGSGDESVEGVFSYNNKLYVFGSTSSSDLDMDAGGGVYMAQLSAQLDTECFFQYGESGDTLVKALMCEGGYLLAVNRAAGGSRLLRIDFDGTQVADIDSSGMYQEKFEDLLQCSDRYVAVMSVHNSSTDIVSLKARVYDSSLSLVAEREFSRSYSTEYISLFETADGNYVLAANIVSPLINRLLFIEWGLSKQGLFYDIDLGSAGAYRCESVIPYEYGYIAVIVEDTMMCDIITVTSSFELHSRIYLRQSAVKRAKIMYAPDGYYCLMQRGVDVSAMLILQSSLQYDKTAPQFSAVKDVYSHYIYSSSTLFAAATQRNILLITASERNVISSIAFGGSGMSDVQTVKLGGKFVSVCRSENKTSDCPENYGGSDIWLSLLNEF